MAIKLHDLFLSEMRRDCPGQSYAMELNLVLNTVPTRVLMCEINNSFSFVQKSTDTFVTYICPRVSHFLFVSKATGIKLSQQRRQCEWISGCCSALLLKGKGKRPHQGLVAWRRLVKAAYAWSPHSAPALCCCEEHAIPHVLPPTGPGWGSADTCSLSLSPCTFSSL